MTNMSELKAECVNLPKLYSEFTEKLSKAPYLVFLRIMLQQLQLVGQEFSECTCTLTKSQHAF